MSPLATVLIPTWDAPDTLGPAIETARAQTVVDIEILVVSDGAKPGTLAVADAHAGADSRVRVLRLAKGEARGERNRHEGVLAARSPVVVYLADDDLLLPLHVERLLAALATHDLAQSLNSYVDADDRLHLYAADLSDPAWHAYHLAEPPLNRISITGTAHTVEAYGRVAEGWIVPAPGVPADLTLWRQFFRLPALRAITLPEVTALQFPAPERRGMSPERLRAQRERWEAFARSPDAHERLQELAAEAALRDLVEAGLSLRGLVADFVTVSGALEAHRATLSWRVMAPLRAVRRLTRRG